MTMFDGTKKRHKTKGSELNAQLKQEKGKLKDKQKAELKVNKDAEKTELRHQVKLYEKEQEINEAEISKLQVALTKERDLLSG
jgi:hypothetical protein